MNPNSRDNSLRSRYASDAESCSDTTWGPRTRRQSSYASPPHHRNEYIDHHLLPKQRRDRSSDGRCKSPHGQSLLLGARATPRRPPSPLVDATDYQPIVHQHQPKPSPKLYGSNRGSTRSDPTHQYLRSPPQPTVPTQHRPKSPSLRGRITVTPTNAVQCRNNLTPTPVTTSSTPTQHLQQQQQDFYNIFGPDIEQELQDCKARVQWLHTLNFLQTSTQCVEVEEVNRIRVTHEESAAWHTIQAMMATDLYWEERQKTEDLLDRNYELSCRNSVLEAQVVDMKWQIDCLHSETESLRSLAKMHQTPSSMCSPVTSVSLLKATDSPPSFVRPAGYWQPQPQHDQCSPEKEAQHGDHGQQQVVQHRSDQIEREELEKRRQQEFEQRQQQQAEIDVLRSETMTLKMENESLRKRVEQYLMELQLSKTAVQRSPSELNTEHNSSVSSTAAPQQHSNSPTPTQQLRHHGSGSSSSSSNSASSSSQLLCTPGGIPTATATTPSISCDNTTIIESTVDGGAESLRTNNSPPSSDRSEGIDELQLRCNELRKIVQLAKEKEPQLHNLAQQSLDQAEALTKALNNVVKNMKDNDATVVDGQAITISEKGDDECRHTPTPIVHPGYSSTSTSLPTIERSNTWVTPTIERQSPSNSNSSGNNSSSNHPHQHQDENSESSTPLPMSPPPPHPPTTASVASLTEVDLKMLATLSTLDTSQPPPPQTRISTTSVSVASTDLTLTDSEASGLGWMAAGVDEQNTLSIVMSASGKDDGATDDFSSHPPSRLSEDIHNITTSTTQDTFTDLSWKHVHVGSTIGDIVRSATQTELQNGLLEQGSEGNNQQQLFQFIKLLHDMQSSIDTHQREVFELKKKVGTSHHKRLEAEHKSRKLIQEKNSLCRQLQFTTTKIEVLLHIFDSIQETTHALKDNAERLASLLTSVQFPSGGGQLGDKLVRGALQSVLFLCKTLGNELDDAVDERKMTEKEIQLMQADLEQTLSTAAWPI